MLQRWNQLLCWRNRLNWQLWGVGQWVGRAWRGQSVHSGCGDLLSSIFLETNTTMAKILQYICRVMEGKKSAHCSRTSNSLTSQLVNWFLIETCRCKKQGAGRAGALLNWLVLKYTFHFIHRQKWTICIFYLEYCEYSAAPAARLLLAAGIRFQAEYFWIFTFLSTWSYTFSEFPSNSTDVFTLVFNSSGPSGLKTGPEKNFNWRLANCCQKQHLLFVFEEHEDWDSVKLKQER